MNDNYVKKQTFQWTIGIIITVLGSLLGVVYNKADRTSVELSTYKDSQYTLLMSMSNDISFIKATLQGYEIEY